MKKLPKRQVEEFHYMVKNLKPAGNFEAEMETVARFAEDLKSYIRNHSENQVVHQLLDEIPSLNFQRAKTSLMDVLITFFGSIFLAVPAKIRMRRQLIRKAEETASIFNRILWEIA